MLNLWLLSDDIKHTVFQRFLVFTQSVLLPSIVEDRCVQVVSLHAFVEQAYAVFVVGLLLEFEQPAIFHVLLEFDRVALAQLVYGGLQLLLFDVLILFVFVFAWEILPWK